MKFTERFKILSIMSKQKESDNSNKQDVSVFNQDTNPENYFEPVITQKFQKLQCLCLKCKKVLDVKEVTQMCPKCGSPKIEYTECFIHETVWTAKNRKVNHK